jgi:hypothetical protein
MWRLPFFNAAQAIALRSFASIWNVRMMLHVAMQNLARNVQIDMRNVMMSDSSKGSPHSSKKDYSWIRKWCEVSLTWRMISWINSEQVKESSLKRDAFGI